MWSRLFGQQPKQEQLSDIKSYSIFLLRHTLGDRPAQGLIAYARRTLPELTRGYRSIMQLLLKQTLPES